MTHGKRYPYAVALNVAEALRTVLEPFCERIVIAGSLRRQKPDVGDIELLYVPKFFEEEIDLFGLKRKVSITDKKIQELNNTVIAKRPNKNGVYTWGESNKLGIHIPSGIPVDLFATDFDRWWNALVVRTGGKDNNLLITTTAQKKGYRFEAYGSGFLTRDGHHQTTSERDVYEFIGLPYLEPKDRK